MCSARLSSELAHATSISDFYKKKSEVLENNLNAYMKNEIDFGTAKLYYAIEPGSVCVINEVMKAMKDAAQIVPLTELLTAINRSRAFPRL